VQIAQCVPDTHSTQTQATIADASASDSFHAVNSPHLPPGSVSLTQNVSVASVDASHRGTVPAQHRLLERIPLRPLMSSLDAPRPQRLCRHVRSERQSATTLSVGNQRQSRQRCPGRGLENRRPRTPGRLDCCHPAVGKLHSAREGGRTAFVEGVQNCTTHGTVHGSFVFVLSARVVVAFAGDERVFLEDRVKEFD